MMAGKAQNSSTGISSSHSTSYTPTDAEKSMLRYLQNQYLNLKTPLVCEKIENYPLDDGPPPLTVEQGYLRSEMRRHCANVINRFWVEFAQRCACQNCGLGPLKGYNAHSNLDWWSEKILNRVLTEVGPAELARADVMEPDEMLQDLRRELCRAEAACKYGAKNTRCFAEPNIFVSREVYRATA